MKILLDKIMDSKNLTVRQVSIMTGVSKSAIGAIASHQKMPKMDTMEKLAEGLKIHIEDLYESDFK